MTTTVARLSTKNYHFSQIKLPSFPLNLLYCWQNFLNLRNTS